uniref:Uncharacterized protein n=1 Tax=Arundo donax TaxID=35708 RepID=A0A0A9H405_ARUDO
MAGELGHQMLVRLLGH